MSVETEHVLEKLAQALIESLTPGREDIRECVAGLWAICRVSLRHQDLMNARSFLIRIAEEVGVPWMDIDSSFHSERRAKRPAPAGKPPLVVKRRPIRRP